MDGALTRVAIAGSSGSIGTQTLDVVRAENERLPGSYEVVALAVGGSAEAVIEQAREFRPAVVAVSDPDARRLVAEALPGVEVVAELAAVVEPADVVVNGVVGFAGLDITIETLRAGKRLALANKESLIAAGRWCSRCATRRERSWCRSTASTARCISVSVRRSMPAARSRGCC